VRKIGIDVLATAPVAAETPPGEGAGERAGRTVSGAAAPAGVGLTYVSIVVADKLGAVGAISPAASLPAGMADVDARSCGTAVCPKRLGIAVVPGHPRTDTGAVEMGAAETGDTPCCDAAGERSPLRVRTIGGARPIGSCSGSGRGCRGSVELGHAGSAGTTGTAGSEGSGSDGGCSEAGSEGSVSGSDCSDASAGAIATGVEPASRAAGSPTFPIVRDASPSTAGASVS
jgi:hypothetical protein